MRAKSRKPPLSTWEGSKLIHEGHLTAEEARKAPIRNTAKERARVLRLGKSAAKKLVEGTIKLNRAKRK